MRTVEWNYSVNCLNLIDQRILPTEFRIVSLCNHLEVSDAIQKMVVRGAPAIGVTAAFGMALAAIQSNTNSVIKLIEQLESAAVDLSQSRPTAVNLTWAVNQILHFIHKGNFTEVFELKRAILAEAQRLADQDVDINLRMAKVGSTLINDGDTIIHHCNTGALATVDWGTALGVIRMAHEQGKKIRVLVDETRPRLQGARLTAWELQQYGIPYDIISDNAAGFFLQRGLVQKVFFGADRVAANGDVANKIGTYMLALAANANQVPVYAVVPTSTIDLTLQSGELIPIEERSSNEVLDIQLSGDRVTPLGSSARNPAFDITPHRYLSGIVTENGIIYSPFSENLRNAVQGA
jgi:methylthioribose-1-phosphate isomerase